jgi:DNA-binding NarL/FixJ family response regulator
LKVRPDLKILVFSMFGEADYLQSMILLGISGFIVKSTSLDSLEKAIRTVADGGQFFSPELNVVLARKLRQVSAKDIPAFTKKETEILRNLCKGMSTMEISKVLSVSKRTVEGYRAKMIQKTGVSNTTSLVIFAIKNNLVKLEEIGQGA